MSRVRYILKAPPNTSESIIEGAYYWPNEAGEVGTTVADHVKVLRNHGYELVRTEDISVPSTTHALINYEEMGKTELANALIARGVSWDRARGRPALEEAAEAWNDLRRGPKATVRTDDRVDPFADLGKGARLTLAEVAELPIPELRARLEAEGVALAKPMPPAALRKAARDHLERTRAA